MSNSQPATFNPQPAVPPGYKQTEVGVIPEEWDVKRLGELGTIVRGGSPRPAGDPRYFNGDFIPWLTVASLTNIPDNKLFVTETASRLTREGSLHSRTLQNGLLVMVNSGAKTLGVAKILSLTCCANDGIAALVGQREGERRFLCYYLNSQTKHLREVVAAGNDQLNLNTGRISLIPVPLPEADEQRAIAEALSDVDGLLGGWTGSSPRSATSNRPPCSNCSPAKPASPASTASRAQSPDSK